MSFLRPMRSESAPNTVKNGMASQQRYRHHDIGRARIDLEDGLQIKQRVELAGVPDHALPGRGAEQRNQHVLQIHPFGERVVQRLGASSSPPP